jgi:DNA-binding NarL/FixJ family response regulator
LIRIIIADDHASVRKGVCAILDARQDVEICAEASNGQEAIDKAYELKPDLIILDITMPVLGGFEAAKILRRTLPEVPILMLSMHESEQVVEQVKKIGVQGYVIKTQAAETLLAAVDALLRNQNFFPSDSEFRQQDRPTAG